MVVTGSPEDKPLFAADPVKASETPYPSTEPPEVNAVSETAGPPVFDHELAPDDPAAPSPGILNRYREVARLSALGTRNCDIAATLGYTESRVSIILKDPFVQAEVARWRNQLFDSDTLQTIKEASKDGARRIHALIRDPTTKESTALAASQFAVEMTHGKARQAVTVENNSLSAFMEMLTAMRARGEAIDVSPDAPAQAPALRALQASDAPQDEFDTWLNSHLPPPTPVTA
jgi:hypothetical protein